ncbi:hypothetical protein DFJ63DRAFT_314487 [Scheffersomyces coipomensis]|uniref:uncharacterized protein n=1 Tax=Scheffersomyces coipomensis TaxID=1788519 RepID=UPI00315D4A29
MNFIYYPFVYSNHILFLTLLFMIPSFCDYYIFINEKPQQITHLWYTGKRSFNQSNYSYFNQQPSCTPPPQFPFYSNSEFHYNLSQENSIIIDAYRHGKSHVLRQ